MFNISLPLMYAAYQNRVRTEWYEDAYNSGTNHYQNGCCIQYGRDGDGYCHTHSDFDCEPGEPVEIYSEELPYVNLGEIGVPGYFKMRRNFKSTEFPSPTEQELLY